MAADRLESGARAGPVRDVLVAAGPTNKHILLVRVGMQIVERVDVGTRRDRQLIGGVGADKCVADPLDDPSVSGGGDSQYSPAAIRSCMLMITSFQEVSPRFLSQKWRGPNA